MDKNFINIKILVDVVVVSRILCMFLYSLYIYWLSIEYNNFNLIIIMIYCEKYVNILYLYILLCMFNVVYIGIVI